MNMKHKPGVILCFILPTLIIFGVFLVGPLVPTVIRSFYAYKNMKLGDFVGIKNYAAVLRDPLFMKGAKNTLKLVVLQLLIGMPLSFLFAVLITIAGSKTRRFFKTVSFLPSVLSVSAVCMLWYMLIQPDYGPVGYIMRLLGLGDYVKAWLAIPQTAFNVISLTFIWQFIGYNMVLFYSGLKAIPATYFEAARIDGASLPQQVFLITIPLLQDTFKFVLILMVTGCLSMVANAQILTRTGLGGAAYTTIFYIILKAFSSLDFGQGYAATMIYAIGCFAIIQVVNALVARQRTEYI